MKQLIWIDLLVGGAVLLSLASVGAGMVHSSLKPLVEIERTAAAIAGGDLTEWCPTRRRDGRRRPQRGPAIPSAERDARSDRGEAAFTAGAASKARVRSPKEWTRQFIADASHELRTPLTTFRGLAELYRQGAGREPQQTAGLLRRTEDEASPMGLLVEDLLLARMDRESRIALVPVELRPSLRRGPCGPGGGGDRRRAPHRASHRAWQRAAGRTRRRRRLRQVVGNLMTNALAHTPPDAAVELRLRAEPENQAVIDAAERHPVREVTFRVKLALPRKSPQSSE